MRMIIGVTIAVLTLTASLALASLDSHRGLVLAIGKGKVLLLERGNERSFSYDEKTVCYLAGRKVACDRVRPNAQVRIETSPARAAVVRIIVDDGAK